MHNCWSAYVFGDCLWPWFGPRVSNRVSFFPGFVSAPSGSGSERNGVSMATDTISRVGYRSVEAPAPSNPMVGNRVPFSPSFVPGPSMDGKERDGALMVTDTASLIGQRSVEAPAPPNTAYGPGVDAMVEHRVPFSPTFGPSMGTSELHWGAFSPHTVPAAGIFSGGGRMPDVRQPPDVVNSVRSFAAGSESRVPNVGASGAADGGCNERRAASTAGSLGVEYMHSEMAEHWRSGGYERGGAGCCFRRARSINSITD